MPIQDHRYSLKYCVKKLKQRGEKFSHVSKNLEDSVDTIYVFPALSPAAKDLLLALREEVAWEDLVVKRV